MSRTKKTPKFIEFGEFENTYEFGKDSPKVEYFAGDVPLVLEIGCGKAEPTLAFARKYKNTNFIGIDIKADRLWRPAKTALTEGLKNVAFIKMNVRLLDKAFMPSSISAIWLTFSDPYPKVRQEKHRLTHPDFLKMYKTILAPSGKIFFKTDDRWLFDWSLAQFAHDGDATIEELSYNLHEDTSVSEDAKIITFYEQKFINEGKPINYCQLSV